MSDTVRYELAAYGMLEYRAPAIAQMDNKAEYIQACLAHCKPWLAQEARLRHYDALRIFLDDAHEVWKQAGGRKPVIPLSRDARMMVTEILRRAERAAVLGMLAGQQGGEIGRKGEVGGWPEKMNATAGRGVQTIRQATGLEPRTLQEIRPLGALTDEEFEAALARAREMGRMSRSNVIYIAVGDQREADHQVPDAADRSPWASGRRRQLIRDLAKDGLDSRQMEQVLGTTAIAIRRIARDVGIDIPAENLTTRTKHIRADRIVTEAISTLEGVALSMDLVDVWTLDREKIREMRLAGQRAMRQINARFTDMKEVEDLDREHSNGSNSAPRQ